MSTARTPGLAQKYAGFRIVLPLLMSGVVLGQSPAPIGDVTLSRPGPGLTRASGLSGTAFLICQTDAGCDDDNACTVDICQDGVCFSTSIPDCVPCQPHYTCPPVQIVFLMDTSGSMGDEAAVLCSAIDQIVVDLQAQNVQVSPTILGITETPGGAFSCLTGDVLSLFGGDVPNDPGRCMFPDGSSAFESWGPATAIVADRFDWSDGAIHIIVPVSDEGPCNGNRPDGCNDPGDDRDSIENAIAVASSNSVMVSPITGSGSNDCVLNLSNALAAGTGGTAFQTAAAGTDLPDAIVGIILESCEIDLSCDDGLFCTTDETCTDGTCGGGVPRDCSELDDQCKTGVCNEETDSCEAEPAFDGEPCDDGLYCTDEEICSNGECANGSPRDCSVLNDQCNLGLCNETSDTCDRQPAREGEPCDDGLYCTDGETCGGGLCANAGPRDCSELDGICVVGACDETRDACVTNPLAEGETCDDGDFCTIWDECDGAGGCGGTDLATITCHDDEECFGSTCNADTGYCVCAVGPTLCLEVEPVDGCHEPGEVFAVNVRLGRVESHVVAGQFFLRYDPSLLTFNRADPGRVADETSRFVNEIFEQSDPVEGTVFLAVTTDLGDPGTQGPALMATMWFTPVPTCGVVLPLCLTSEDQSITILTDSMGSPVPFEPGCCTGEIAIGHEDAALTCPESLSVNADAGGVTSVVTWDPVEVVGQVCSDPVITCSAHNSLGADIDHLIAAGGEFPTGISHFECSATSICGTVGICSWDVGVSRANLVELDLQLSPRVIAETFHRCIELEFFSDCVTVPTLAAQTVRFGLPFDLPGYATEVPIKVPAGNYFCVTARDPLHTLRSAATPEIVDTRYVLDFTGDPFFGGRWLVGGNLNGDNLIDSLDLALFRDQYLSTVDIDTPCGTAPVHSDINGDGIVDVLDFSFIDLNFLAHDKAACCPGGASAAAASPMTEIPLRDLESMGLGHLIDGDLNGDGVLGVDDIVAWMQGQRPPAKTTRSRTSLER